MSPKPHLEDAIQALRAKDKLRAREILKDIITEDPQNDEAWMYLAFTVENRKQALACLERATQINPANDRAWEWIKKLESQTTSQTQQKAASNGNKSNLLLLALIGVSSLLVISLLFIAGFYVSGYFNTGSPVVVTPMLVGDTAQTLNAAPTSTRDPLPTWTPTPRPSSTPYPTPRATWTSRPITPRPTLTPRPTRTPRPTFNEVTRSLGPIYDPVYVESFSTEITIHKVGWRTDDGFTEVKDGYVYAVVELTVKNLGPDPMHSVSAYNFQTLDANGAFRSGNSFLVSDCSFDDFVNLSSGGKISGCVGFEVPASGRLEFIYAPYQYGNLEQGRYLSIVLRP